MTRSRVLLHCNGDWLAAARTLAWEGRRPSSIRVLLADPRWEACLLKFIELSDVGRIVDEVDVEEDWAVGLDGWIAWEAEGRGVGWQFLLSSLFCTLSLGFLLLLFVQGSLCAQLADGVEDFVFPLYARKCGEVLRNCHYYVEYIL